MAQQGMDLTRGGAERTTSWPTAVRRRAAHPGRHRSRQARRPATSVALHGSEQTRAGVGLVEAPDAVAQRAPVAVGGGALVGGEGVGVLAVAAVAEPQLGVRVALAHDVERAPDAG